MLPRREEPALDTTAVRLLGGPEDGREVTVAADSAGTPVPRITLPAPARDARAFAPQLAYERRTCRPDGTWQFHYVGTET